jgi:hypothetical protein
MTARILFGNYESCQLTPFISVIYAYLIGQFFVQKILDSKLATDSAANNIQTIIYNRNEV